MTELPLISALNDAFETPHGYEGGADDKLGLALIWLIELYASELAISHADAAVQIALMCELTRILESDSRGH